ncbi:MAG: D-specific alpha-keto acid dehydrogenase [Bacteroidetes bacterium ADurb.Bin408]|nr:MAG: D-specific alpha-keto acid dehydrogenase [Bacteroidetes bacterium ADurb.Bin408]
MGSSFARCVSGLGAEVIAYDKYKKGYSDTFVKESSLDNLFNTTDILSLHVPLSAETHYMVNTEFISKFKKNIFLLNTSRGKVVKTDDLVIALKTGKISGAALDVIEYEDVSFQKLDITFLPEAYKFLCAAHNVVLTPHVAGWTQESKIKLVEVLADKIKKLNL